ncbi:MAG: NAD(+)/NADH kinase [Mariprofundus sp.]|nr:NAD(+)/NADH kinase [Mariprofundus sp.]
MNRIGITIKPDDDPACELMGELQRWLLDKGCTVYIDETLDHSSVCSALCHRLPMRSMAAEVELLIVLGGDGTLLHAARHFIDSSIPILGINLGRLGFLTDTPIGSMFDVVEDILAGNLKTKRHFTLMAEVWRGDKKLAQGTAMNDVVLERSAHPRMISFEMAVRDQFVFRMRADGLILATPAGSTAYALSAGGPIVHPLVEAITIVPVCPHTLSNRPIVLPADDVIQLRLVESPLTAAVNLDGIELMQLEEGDRLTIAKGGYVSLVYLPDRHYFEMLRSKLNWAGQLARKE